VIWKKGLLVGVVLSVALAGSALLAWAESPAPAMPAVDPKMQPYVDALAYWFKSTSPGDWAARLAEALIPAPDQKQHPDDDKAEPEDGATPVTRPPVPGAERVVLTGVPSNAWWIDAWRLDLDGTWVKVPSWRPADQLPASVSGDLTTQGKLPGVYVLRICDKSGAVLLESPRLIVVSWTSGSGGTWNQTFDVPGLPRATADQLSHITM
jgi:hypothetical protein